MTRAITCSETIPGPHPDQKNRQHGFTPLRPSRAVLQTPIGAVETSRGLIANLSGNELARLGIAAGVAGVSHEHGREHNARLIAAHIEAGGRA